MGSRIENDAHPCQPAQDDQGIVRPVAQALRARQEVKELGIVRLARLDGPPRQVVEYLVRAPAGRVQCQLAAFAHVAAFLGARTLGSACEVLCQRKDEDNE
jgi:hypothetical protein